MNNGQGLTVKELANLLELTPRWIQQLAKEGIFPKIERGKYPLDECVRAYVQYWKERAEGRFTESELDQTRLQKEHLEVRKRAVQVAKAEGSVVALEDHEEVIRKLLGAVRAVLLGIPGAWSARVVGLGTPAEGLVLMRKLADEVVEGVAASADTFEIEDSFQPELIPDDFPGVKHLRIAGITTMEQLRGFDDFTIVKGIGEKTAERMEQAVAA